MYLYAQIKVCVSKRESFVYPGEDQMSSQDLANLDGPHKSMVLTSFVYL